MLNQPKYIRSNIVDLPLDFDWNNAIAVEVRNPDAQPTRLAQAIWAINFKAKMALALTCLEWIFWRLNTRTDVSDGLRRIEAAWAATIHTDYSRDLDFDDIRDDVHHKGNPDGPRQTALILLDRLHMGWRRNHPGVEQIAIMCAHLAQRVLPHGGDYETWLQETLTALTSAYPVGPDFRRSERSYDHSSESPIPRAWFESLTVPPNNVSDRIAWDAFLRGLRPADNPYLVPPDEMRANGFIGEPYRMD
jgi:hypothetical protein